MDEIKDPISYAFYQGYQNGYMQCKIEEKKERLKQSCASCAYCGGCYTVVDNEHNKYVADSEVKYCFHCGRRIE